MHRGGVCATEGGYPPNRTPQNFHLERTAARARACGRARSRAARRLRLQIAQQCAHAREKIVIMAQRGNSRKRPLPRPGGVDLLDSILGGMSSTMSALPVRPVNYRGPGGQEELEVASVSDAGGPEEQLRTFATNAPNAKLSRSASKMHPTARVNNFLTTPPSSAGRAGPSVIGVGVGSGPEVLTLPVGPAMRVARARQYS